MMLEIDFKFVYDPRSLKKLIYIYIYIYINGYIGYFMKKVSKKKCNMIAVLHFATHR